jgi:DNA polymerase-3 subunit epsilon
MEDGREPEEKSIVLMEEGKFYGMGYLNASLSTLSPDDLKQHLTIYPETDYIRNLIYQYVSKWPERKVVL